MTKTFTFLTLYEFIKFEFNKMMKCFFLTTLLLLVASCSAYTKPDNSQLQNPTALSSSQKKGSTNKKSLPPVSQEFKTGEILVQFEENILPERIEEICQETGLKHVRVVNAPGLYLLKMSSESTVQDSIEQLLQYNEVRYAEPNYLRKTH